MVETKGNQKKFDVSAHHHVPPEQIKHAEETLAIKTFADRLKEASLFIDYKFLQVAIISGQEEGLQHIFGEEPWLRSFAPSTLVFALTLG